MRPSFDHTKSCAQILSLKVALGRNLDFFWIGNNELKQVPNLNHY